MRELPTLAPEIASSANLTQGPQRMSEFYRRTLLQDVIPFWMRHGYDARFGGIGNMLADDGQILGHDKYLWSQGRALWTFSALCNRVERRDEWRQFADHIFTYLCAHGRDEQARWMYRLDCHGQVLDRDTSIYVDGFVMNGMGEYFLATGNDQAQEIALQTYAAVAMRLAVPGSYGTAPYDIPPGSKTHGVAMIFSYFFFNLGESLKRADIREHGLRLADEILDHFYVASKDAIVEFVSVDGSYLHSPQGRACVPGHALEALWFLISIFERIGDSGRIETCCRLIKRHLELAWDEEFGGLRLALDIEGREPVYWQNADCKPWWVQVEALVATAYAHLHCRQSWCLEWHEKVRAWAFQYYPFPGGEWTQWLDRSGQKVETTLLPVKDPFHLPRALMVLTDVFERIEGAHFDVSRKVAA